ncbi:Regulator of chromosome condensation (RCC1) repeat protein [Sarcoptes scabiei]|uniref:Regulator of chromosome condensation (RCC1) repeat protein n=1 Tax=Sarcoptes scabiei TaxID=52283 RepID=A0A132AB82_SARSC|nr:Regulator of chromosome condensation (RCC1) repeat protein [Sarcoptes scabiei]
MLYYCGFDSFLQFRNLPDSGVYLHSLGDLVLDDHDAIINAYIGWCSLFLQTAKDQIIFLGYSKNKRHNSLTVCSKVPKYIINIECGSKETFLLTLDSIIYKWFKTPPVPVTFQESENESPPNNGEDSEHIDSIKPAIKVEQLSIGAVYSCILTDEKEAFLFDINELKLDKKITEQKIVQVSAGQEHLLLLTENGEVLSYGTGSRGQLGHGNIDDCLEKANVIEALNGVKCKAIAAGGWHSIALSEIGDVYVWGWNESGQLGFSREEIKTETTPKLLEVSEDDNFMAIGAGSRHSMAVSENGILFGWGWNKYGQLGMSPQNVYFDSPNVIPFDYKVSNISCKFWSSLIETKNDS